MSVRALFLNPASGLRSGWRMLLFALAFAGALILLAVVSAGLGRPPLLASHHTPTVLLLGLSLLALKVERRPLRELGMALNGRFVLELGMGIGVGAALIGGAALLVWLAGGFHWTPNPKASGIHLARSVLGMMGVALVEELLFRGYLFQRLVEGVGLRIALALGAAGFALMHWGNPGMVGATKVWATVNIALAAVLLGLAWERTRGLALPIGIHFAWNWVQGPLFGFQVSGTGSGGWLQVVFHGRPDWLTGGAFGLEASLPGCLVLLVPIVWLWKRKAGPEPIEAPSESASAIESEQPTDPVRG